MDPLEATARELKMAKEHLKDCQQRHSALLKILQTERTGQEWDQYKAQLEIARVAMDLAQVRYDAAAIAYSRLFTK